MNKKFTFMVAALLAAGSFSSNVFAQTPYEKALKNGVKVYLGSNTNQLMKAAKDQALSDGTKVASFHYTDSDSKDIATAISDASLFEISDYALLGTEKATFKLKYDGQYVYIKNDGTLKVDGQAKTDLLGTFQISLTDGKVTSSSTINYLNATGDVQSTQLQIKSTSDSFEFGTSQTAVKMYVASEDELTATDLNKHLGNNGFSLDFPLAEGEPAFTDGNIFAQPMKAFYFANTDYAPEAGTYFAVKYPADGKIDSKADFNASTFIVVDPTANYEIHEADAENGIGFKFRTLTGLNIAASSSADAKKGQVPAVNALFTVTETDPTNAAGKMAVTMGQIKYVNEDKDGFETATGEVAVGVVKDQKKNYLTTVEKANALDAVFASSSIVKAEDLLKADKPAVYNIQFTSKLADVTITSNSEYGKYLQSYSYGSSWSLQANGTAFLKLNNPIAQWTISNVEDNEFTFRNRQSGVEIKMTLNKLSNGDYLVLDGTTDAVTVGWLNNGEYDNTTKTIATGIVGTTIKLIETTINTTAGYATIADENLQSLATLKFNKPDDITADDLFVTLEGSGKKVVVNKDDSKAAQFEVVKFDGATSESEVAVTDTLYTVNGFAYWNAKDKKVETKVAGDTLAVVTYAFKQYTNDGKNWYLNANASNVVELVAGEAPAKFILKENLNGSYSLLQADKFTHTAANANVFSVSADGTLAYTNTLYDAVADQKNIVRDFSIVTEAPTPSLNHVPQHVALNSTLGYVAMSEAGDAIVAPVSSLKAEYTKDDLTFWLDTTDSKAYTPSFYISKGVKDATDRMFLYNAVDSAYHYDEATASIITDYDYLMPNKSTVKAIFQAATLKDSETMVVNTKDITADNGLNNFKFQIIQKTEDSEGEYVVKSVRDNNYLMNVNGKLGFTLNKENALVVAVEEMEAPTSNESVSASEVKVVANDGSIVVKNAAGKNVVVSTILGQVVANEVLTSDNATINVPAGIVVVAVDGESFKVSVK